MPKRSFRPPKYSRHKASGQAIVKFSGRVHYLGPHGSEESKARYQQAIAKWATERGNEVRADPAPAFPPSENATVDGLVADYWDHAVIYYRRNGEPTWTVASLKPILKEFREKYGQTLLRDFSPGYLEVCRQDMIDRGCSISYINGVVTKLKTMSKWGVAKDLVPPDVFHRLQTLAGLQRGPTVARATAPIQPLSDGVVDATLPYLPQVVADMVLDSLFLSS